MTVMRFERRDMTNHMVAEGHAGEGENIYCAAVSAMCSALVTALGREDLMSPPRVVTGSGYMAVSAMRTPRTDAMFDMLRAGCEAMAATWPARVKVEK